MIWFKKYGPEDLNERIPAENALHYAGLEFLEIGDDYLKARMPVDSRTRQVHGILHGGITCLLAETVGSFASLMVIDTDRYIAVGSVITANHLRPVRDGYVTATCRPVHLGRSKHVWDIQLHADNGKLAAKCELTCAIIEKSESA